MKLSVVIPAYNEQRDIFKAVYEVFYEYPDAEVIVVNDASTDNTLSELHKFSKKLNLHILTNLENKGHGYSVIRGLLS